MAYELGCPRIPGQCDTRNARSYKAVFLIWLELALDREFQGYVA